MEAESPRDSPEKERKFEAEISAFLMNEKRVVVKALFSPQKIGTFFKVSPSVVTNWQARYENFPKPELYVSKIPVFDIRNVVRWWIHWRPVNRNKSGALPENWEEILNA